ncbi:hypothetical protein AMJ83_10415 [candidate division WOR_3 bacterium SM23_42]|uniref:Transmembrane protein n=1 Tax=candidate division WOR_3 bacterium SM23_42 TaxID=1703779 RepID=A0A0S8FT28_UNCW3|nr:MAG: hypothetical protein AMJ83_10415 [candidate division WOR_3 bacterium SM23_42]
MKKYISTVLLLVFISLLHAQTDAKQQNSNNSVDREVGDNGGQEECCEGDPLSLLKRPSYGKVEVSWSISRRPQWFQSEEDTAKVATEEKERSRGSCLTSCIIGTVVLAGIVLILAAALAKSMTSF